MFSIILNHYPGNRIISALKINTTRHTFGFKEDQVGFNRVIEALLRAELIAATPSKFPTWIEVGGMDVSDERNVLNENERVCKHSQYLLQKKAKGDAF